MNTPSILWTSLEAAVITGGKNTREWQATGVCVNAQEVKPGDLFFATPDDDLNAVFMKGAAAAVVPAGMGDIEWPLLYVPDVFAALQAMARAARFKTHAQIVAVQGMKARRSVHKVISSVFDVSVPRRHLSLSLAALPEECDFAVFGFSPLVRPDIAIVTGCANVDATVFESMAPAGRVLVCAEGGDVAAVIAKARAAGIRNIFTYGRAVDSDAVLVDTLPASNGIRVRMRVLGEAVDTILPAGEEISPEMLAGVLVLKLSEVTAPRIAMALTGEMETAPPSSTNLALLDRMLKNPTQAAFKVVNMIDVGYGNRKLVLDNIETPRRESALFSNKELDIPLKIDNLELVYACKGVPLLTDAEAAVRQARPGSMLGKIVPDVLSPGDFLTFRGLKPSKMLGSPRKLFSSALRLMPQTGKTL